jgi:hypothetical protein
MKALILLLAFTLPASSFGKFPAPTDRDKYVYMRAGGLEISKEGHNNILKHEVGGGSRYYNRYLIHPVYVSKYSGITICVGYDLKYKSKAQIAADFHMLHPSVIKRLQAVAGKNGTRAMARGMRSISIPYSVALEVFNKSSIPRFAKLVNRAYPGIDTLHPHIQSAFLSNGFNRGTAISETKSRDKEKREARAAIPNRPGLLGAIIRASKRLWVGMGLDGLLGHREDEAILCDLGNTLSN